MFCYFCFFSFSFDFFQTNFKINRKLRNKTQNKDKLERKAWLSIFRSVYYTNGPCILLGNLFNLNCESGLFRFQSQKNVLQSDFFLQSFCSLSFMRIPKQTCSQGGLIFGNPDSCKTRLLEKCSNLASFYRNPD